MCVIVLGNGDQEFSLSPRKKKEEVDSPADPASLESTSITTSPTTTDVHADAETGGEPPTNTTDADSAVKELSCDDSTSEMKIAPSASE